MENYIAWMKSAYYISAAGNPAMSVPCAFSASGLPDRNSDRRASSRRLGRPAAGLRIRAGDANREAPSGSRLVVASQSPTTNDHRLNFPIFVVAQKVARVPVVECGLQEQSRYRAVAHLLEAAIAGIDAASHDGELASRHLLAQHVVLGEVYLLVKTAQFEKALAVEKHKHAGTEGAMDA